MGVTGWRTTLTWRQFRTVPGPLGVANMGFGGLMYFLSQVNLFWYTKNILINIPKMATGLRLGRGNAAPMLATGGMTQFTSPAVSPAYLGVGYIIGPRLASLNFAGGVVAWGLLVPLLIYFLGPNLPAMPEGAIEGSQ